MTGLRVGWIVFLANTVAVYALAQRGEVKLCPDVVSNLVPQFVAKKPVADLPHVELRRCDGGMLQLAAWEGGGGKPALIRNTYRPTLNRVLMANSVFVFVLSGGSYDVIQVLKYERGHPRIIYEDSTKGEINIAADFKSISITTTEDGNPKVTRFDPNVDDLDPR